MAIDIFKWRSMTDAVNQVTTVPSGLVDLVAGNNIKRHNSNVVDFEIVSGDDTIAKVVGKNGTANEVTKKTRTLKGVTLPSTYEKTSFNAKQIAELRGDLGGVLVGSAADVAAAANKNILSELLTLKNRVTRLRGLSIAQQLSTGLISLPTADGETFEIDFGFTSGTHKDTVASGFEWNGGASSDIIADFRNGVRKVSDRGDYSTIIAIAGRNAFDAFAADAAVQKAFDTNNYKVGSLVMDNGLGNKVLKPRGIFEGVPVYEYSQKYKDASGTTQDMWDTDVITFYGMNANTQTHYGPIYRFDSNNGSLMVANEMLLYPVVNDEKTLLTWYLEQCSLTVAHDLNSIYAYTACL